VKNGKYYLKKCILWKNGKYYIRVYTLSQQTSDVSRQLPFKMGATDQVSKTKGSIKNGPTMDGIVSYREEQQCVGFKQVWISSHSRTRTNRLEGHHKRRLSPVLRTSRVVGLKEVWHRTVASSACLAAYKTLCLTRHSFLR
jgi:hypothetical protein